MVRHGRDIDWQKGARVGNIRGMEQMDVRSVLRLAGDKWGRRGGGAMGAELRYLMTERFP